MDNNISLRDFLEGAKSRGWGDAEIESAIKELQAKGTTVDGWDQFKDAANLSSQMEKPQKQTDLGQAVAIGLGLGAIPGVIGGNKLVRNIIGPSKTEIGDAVAWVNKWLVGAGGGMKPENIDTTKKNIIKLLGESDQYVDGLNDARSLYNYAQSIKDLAFKNKESIKAEAGDRTITTKALDPLKESIAHLEKVGADKSKIQTLQNQYDNLLSKFDSNGEMPVSDAEGIKEYHAGESNYYKSAGKVGASPEANASSLGHTKVAEGFRNEINDVVPELQPRNEKYGAAKDIEAGLAKLSNITSQQRVATPLRNLGTKVAKVIKDVPGIATAGKALNPLDEATYAERNIPKYINIFKKYGDKAIDYINAEASKGKIIADGIKSAIGEGLEALPEELGGAIGKGLEALPEELGSAEGMEFNMPSPIIGADSKGRLTIVGHEPLLQPPIIDVPKVISLAKEAISPTLTPQQKQKQEEDIKLNTIKGQQTPGAGNVQPMPNPINEGIGNMQHIGNPINVGVGNTQPSGNPINKQITKKPQVNVNNVMDKIGINGATGLNIGGI